MTLKIYFIQIVSRHALGIDIKLRRRILLGTQYVSETGNSLTSGMRF
jgi:hypothetical protein